MQKRGITDLFNFGNSDNEQNLSDNISGDWSLIVGSANAAAEIGPLGFAPPVFAGGSSSEDASGGPDAAAAGGKKGGGGPAGGGTSGGWDTRRRGTRGPP